MQSREWMNIKEGKVTVNEEQPEDGDLTIAEMDGKYSTLRPTNKETPRLHIIKKDGTVHTFLYMHLDAHQEFHGDTFTLIFVVEGNRQGAWQGFLENLRLLRAPSVGIFARSDQGLR